MSLHHRHTTGSRSCWTTCAGSTPTASGAEHSTTMLKIWRTTAQAKMKMRTTELGPRLVRLYRASQPGPRACPRYCARCQDGQDGRMHTARLLCWLFRDDAEQVDDGTLAICRILRCGRVSGISVGQCTIFAPAGECSCIIYNGMATTDVGIPILSPCHVQRVHAMSPN